MKKKDIFRTLKRIGPESSGLVPVVVQDRTSREILMVAYMDRAALEKTLKTGESHFYSRSRKSLWRKGETSGHTQKVREIFMDCDSDTLLLVVDQTGPACHTGRPSCFFQRLSNGRFRPSRNGRAIDSSAVLERIFEVIEDRRRNPSKDSYVSHLLAGGEDRVLKKVGEEAGEFLLASKGRGKRSGVVHEAADLLFHLLVALSRQQIPPQEVFKELARRFGTSGLQEKKRRRKK
ncbi:MAG TPA: bifunctional phosphoribosyl-AMP cyclohydrolase/phosphoribosyl-ATP diphosphatase HisIE [Nitrospiria bacterium]|nr:bifunctional phosphoribosyl-AMP cyclohydrolase/phosphoribosyl-ATP diphosphatase HisIE [Nitrospiria bacterium]